MMNISLKLRHMRTQAERRAASGLLAERRENEAEGVPVPRPRRAHTELPTVYDDIVVYRQRNWKQHRRTRWLP